MIVWLNLLISARPRQPADEWTEWTPSKYCKKHFLDWTWLSRVEIEHRTVASRQWTVGRGGDKRGKRYLSILVRYGDRKDIGIDKR